MASEKYKRYSVLISSTVSFTVCFMVWMMLAVVGIPVKEELGLTETQFSILAALPARLSACRWASGRTNTAAGL